jgi:transcriptional regulator with XRE-family HTH domain
MVRAARLSAGLSQEELAERLGMSQRWVSNLELGNVKLPRQDTMRALSDVLGIPLEDLYVAAGIAETTTGARKIKDALPHLDPEDPTLDLLMEGARRLTPASRKTLLRHLEAIADLQRQYEEDAARDGHE